MNAATPNERTITMPRSIWMLGFVSMFTDMSSEMVHALMPLLLATGLGASALVIGLIEGSAEALVLITKVFSGYISDALGKRKGLVLLGYGLATATKPFFPLATTVGMVTTARLVDRFGKGIRGAPRDAMVSDIAPPEIRGAAFGLRQSMDTVGAVVGPLLAIALMWLLNDNIRHVLWWAVIPGIIAILFLIKIPEPETAKKAARLPLTREGLKHLGKPFLALTVLGFMIALARFSEAFLVLRAANLNIATTFVPLVMVVMAAVYALSAYPVGIISDRIPRRFLLMLGMLLLLVADVVMGMATTPLMLYVGVVFWGLHMGFTQGVVSSMIADVAPAEHRGTAFGVFNLASGVALLIASVFAGYLWDAHGPATTFYAGAILAMIAVVATPFFAPKKNHAV